MELKNIFRMEMYKNRNNKPYLLVIAILTIMTSVSTFLGIAMIEDKIASDSGVVSIMIPLIVFSALGIGVLSLLFPFHLLNVDYKNKVISLIFASGVSRIKYYFVKISATILTCFIAVLTIMFIPTVTFLLVYPELFVEIMRSIIENFTISNIVPFLLMAVCTLLAYFVTLTTAVIITKGKVSGIFLFFGFSFAVSIFQAMFYVPQIFSFDHGSINADINVAIVFSIVQIIVFALIGLNVLKNQDL